MALNCIVSDSDPSMIMAQSIVQSKSCSYPQEEQVEPQNLPLAEENRACCSCREASDSCSTGTKVSYSTVRASSWTLLIPCLDAVCKLPGSLTCLPMKNFYLKTQTRSLGNQLLM